MRLSFPLLAIAACAGLLAATAGATIVPQKGIAGVSIGMSQAKVRSVLGKPLLVRHGSNDFGTYTSFIYKDLQVAFQGNASVTDISTVRKSERTAGGIGVGSTEAQVKAKLKGVTCKTENGYHHCFLGKFLPGHRVTDLSMKKGRVRVIDVGLVLD
jgi:hypothetical protein